VTDLRRPLRPIPDPRSRPWGGRRFAAVDSRDSVGEVWVAGPASSVADPADPSVLVTLDELAEREGPALVGTAGMALLGARFPLLVKIIDPADWLSLQLHPDDEQAREIDPDSLGKREAWYVIEAAGEAMLVVGAARGVDPDEVRRAVGAGDVPASMLEAVPAERGSIVHVPPGTLHSIGPGALLYEVQQPSDLTLRVSDWGRPTGPDRPLHAAAALRCVDPASRAQIVPPDDDGGPPSLTTDRFRLEAIAESTELRPDGRTVEIVTCVDGSALAAGDGWAEAIERWQTLVIPASVERYEVRPGPGARVCIASLP
jgi:mannose-6-phosphate isomerase